MDNILPKMYKSYGEYINSFRSFPLDLDGLKPVERRILLSAFQIAKDKLVKSAKVSGMCMGSYHPHGDNYPSIVNLVNQGFLIGQGNFGTKCGVDPTGAASSRYTECKSSKDIINMAFKYVKHVPWEALELEKEPLYLPTMIPFCLIGKEYTQGIGFGFRTFIPCYKIEDLKKRLFYLLGKIKEKPIIKPITDCDILASDEELEELLTKGKAKINVKGIYEIDNLRKKVYLKSWPTGNLFQSLLKKFSKELESQDIGFTDSSTTETNIVFEVLKQRNVNLIFKNFVKKLDEVLKGSITFETIVVDLDRKVKNMSVDDLLLNTYKMYTETNKTMLNYEIGRCNKLIEENLLIEKVRPVLSKYITNKVKDPSIIIDKITSETQIDKKVVIRLLQENRISKLLTADTDITKFKEEIKSLQNNLNNIEVFVLDQYNNLKMEN